MICDYSEGMCPYLPVALSIRCDECMVKKAYKRGFYEKRPHGEWVDVPKYKGFYVCSKCLERLGGDFERFDHWEMKKENFCSVCGSDNRKAVQSEKDSDRNRG